MILSIHDIIFPSMSLSSRAPVEPQDAIGYIASVEQIFKQQPEFYDQFLEAMVEYNSGR